MEYKPGSAPCCHSTIEGEPRVVPQTSGTTNHSTLQSPIQYCHTGAMTRDLAVEATPRWYGPVLSQLPGKHPASFMPAP